MIAAAQTHIGKSGAQLRVKHRRLWCGEFMGMLADAVGAKKPRNPNWAADWAEVGHRTTAPSVGAIALIGRGKRIAHVGLVTGVDANGNPIILSGNHNDRVAVAPYPRGRIAAYIIPSG